MVAVSRQAMLARVMWSTSRPAGVSHAAKQGSKLSADLSATHLQGMYPRFSIHDRGTPQEANQAIAGDDLNLVPTIVLNSCHLRSQPHMPHQYFPLLVQAFASRGG